MYSLSQVKVEMLFVKKQAALCAAITVAIFAFGTSAYGKSSHQAKRALNAHLLKCIATGNLAGVKKDLKHGANPNCRNADGDPALLEALSRYQFQIAETLVGNGASIDAKVSSNRSLLCFTAEVGSYEPMKFLIDHGASVNPKDNFGESPLDVTVLNFEERVYRDAELARYDERLENRRFLCVRLLLSKGCDVNYVDGNGCTILMGAATRGPVALLRILIAHGANVNYEYRFGSALLCAIEDQNYEKVKLLIDSGAKNHLTGLHKMDMVAHALLPFRHPRIDIIRLLLENGANPNITISGQTGSEYARTMNMPELAQIFKEYETK